MCIRDRHWGSFFTLEELAGRSALDKSGLKHTAEKLAERKILVRLNENLYIHRQEMDFYRKRAEAVLDEFHKANPLKEGMGIEELRRRMKPVSYTHLDVYKRQVQLFPCAERRAGSQGNHIHGKRRRIVELFHSVSGIFQDFVY